MSNQSSNTCSQRGWAQPTYQRFTIDHPAHSTIPPSPASSIHQPCTRGARKCTQSTSFVGWAGYKAFARRMGWGRLTHCKAARYRTHRARLGGSGLLWAPIGSQLGRCVGVGSDDTVAEQGTPALRGCQAGLPDHTVAGNAAQSREILRCRSIGMTYRRLFDLFDGP